MLTHLLSVQGLGVSQDSVNKDLLLYKSILSKMSAAKVCRYLHPLSQKATIALESWKLDTFIAAA